MKIKKFVAGLSAAVLAATMMSLSVSAAKLGDVVHPSEEDSKMNDSYYSIGAMGFYMGQDWTWNQGDWVGIDDTGKITVEYKISKVVTDKTMSGKGTLGDMGVMVANLPDGVYPVDVKISDAKFVAEDGTTTVFDSIKSNTLSLHDALPICYGGADACSSLALCFSRICDTAENIVQISIKIIYLFISLHHHNSHQRLSDLVPDLGRDHFP